MSGLWWLLYGQDMSSEEVIRLVLFVVLVVVIAALGYVIYELVRVVKENP